MKNWAIIGSGQSGSVLAEGLGLPTFSRANPITDQILRDLDGVFIMTPPDALPELFERLLKFPLAVVIGTTGWIPKEKFINVIKEKKLVWVKAANFSLGVNLWFNLINKLKMWSEKLDYLPLDINMFEIHHEKKVDIPSGTALHAKDLWDARIHSERIGQEKPTHNLVVSWLNEEVSLKHGIKDRKAFIKGSKWIMQEIPKLAPGFYNFEEVFARELNNI